MARSKAFDEATALGKAMEVFWSKGYNATSMQDLVDGMGINRASMYDTFGDKHQLYLEALRNYRNLQTQQAIAILENTQSTKEAIHNLLQGVLQDYSCSNNKGCFIVNAAVEFATHDEAVYQIIKNNLEALESALVRTIARGQASGEITSRESPEALAKFIINTINGMRVAEKAGYDLAHFQAIIQTMEHVLFV